MPCLSAVVLVAADFPLGQKWKAAGGVGDLSSYPTARPLCLRLERAMGLEPTTTCLGSRDSTTELRPPCGVLIVASPAFAVDLDGI